MARIFAALVFAFFVVYATAVSGAHHHHRGGHTEVAALGWISGGKSECRGTIAECLGSEEFDLGGESSRRILATQRYISYGALSRDRVPCSRRGASYYNCRPGAQANPYSRGCSAITRCRS